MEFDHVVQNRRSIRKFQPKKVEQSKINQLLEAARLCQSAKNRQPWQFKVLTGADKDEIADIMLSLFEQNDIELPGYANSSKYSAQIIKNADVLFLVFREKDDDWNIGDLLSIGAAIEHICLEAVNLDLGSVWIRDTAYTEAEICRHTGCGELQLVSAIAVGYPAESPLPRPRKTLDEIVLK